MAVKNFWSLDPGVVIFVDELRRRKQFAGMEFYFPFKDTGIDLIGVTKDKKIVSFQVKESRYYEKEDKAWHDVSKKSLETNRGKVDFYVFLIYFPRPLKESEQKGKGFEIYYVIVPEKVLLERAKFKKPVGKGIYRFHFRLSNKYRKVADIREPGTDGRDYSEFLNAWRLI